MDYNSNSLYKNGLNYGLILGFAFIVFTLVMVMFNITNGMISFLANVTFTAVAVYFGNINLRDKYQNGYISYARSLGSGVFIGLVAGLILAIFTYIFYTIISPDSLQASFDAVEQVYLEQGLSDEQIEMALSISKKFMNPTFMVVSSIFNLTLWGFLVSLIISNFVKRVPEDEY